jgi:N-methylhydantoinase A
MPFKISVDTGGTFTDVVVSDDNGKQNLGKALTTPDRIFDGMRNALSVAAAERNMTLDDLLTAGNLLIYGTTRATNAIVTGKVAKTAFVTTKGFPDTLVIKEGGKFNPHDFSADFPKPYVARRNTFEVDERTNSQGIQISPFNYQQAEAICKEIKNRDFEAVAVCFLWSISNPENEKKMATLLSSHIPEMPYTLSHELIPVVREYRRASAAAIDASLKPLMQSHLRDLEIDLRDSGYLGDILVSTTAGGCSNISSLVDKPIYTINSGPAMAPIAGLHFSSLEGHGDNVIVCDTGGTTFDVGLVRDGQLAFSRDTWLGQAYSGHLLGISSVDVRSVGAGGGSIAWIDDGGLMRIGPNSAGANPGPACYGQGGVDATVSDAAAVLGYLNPDFFLGGKMNLDISAAESSIKPIADSIGVSSQLAAWRILTLTGDLMMKAISDITINEGFDPRESSIVAGGGAAGINIMNIARELGCQRVIIPKVASALSASGMQFANIVAEETFSLVTTSDSFDYVGVNSTLSKLENKLEKFKSSMSLYADVPYEIIFTAEARYLGQVWELDTPLPNERIENEKDLSRFVESFHRVHQRVFEVRDEGSPVEIMSWKARLSLSLATKKDEVLENSKTIKVNSNYKRNCWFGGSESLSTPIFKGSDLMPGSTIEGPAIIEEPTTTIVVYPEMTTTISKAGNYIIDVLE